MADVHLFLPELTVDKKITAPSKSGLWKMDGRNVIRGISDAIVTGSSAQGVSSIPDIWARPLMFQNFLFAVYKKLNPKIEKKQPLNYLEKRAFQEWKGLLSILALKETKLRFDKIELVPFDPNRNDRFCKALRTLAPKPIALERNKEYEWTDILLIRYNDIAVGAFSPATLVYTAVDYSSAFKKRFESGAGKSSIVLDAEGYLCPPVKRNDLQAVGEWVAHCKAKLDGLLNTRDETREKDRLLAIMNSVLLEVWLEEIREQLGLHQGESLESEEVRVAATVPYFGDAPAPSFLNRYTIYDTLLHPMETDTSFGQGSKSDVELQFERNLLRYNDKEVKHVLLISDKLYSDDFRIWDQLRFTALGNNIENILSTYFDKPAGQEIKGKDIAFSNEGVLWIRPEQFFLTGTLVAAKNNLDLLSAGEAELNVDARFVLPFRRELLDFFSPRDIHRILRPAYEDKGDRVLFSFTLPVIGKKEGIVIRKVYRRKNAEKGEGTIAEMETPIIDIFPNYLGAQWRRYYLFQANLGRYSVTPIVQSAGAEISSKEYTAPYLDDRQKVSVTSISGDDCFPEGLQLSDDNLPAGLLLLQRSEKSPVLEDEWTVGIDFGTSNTNVYRRIGEDGSPEPWRYDFPGYTRSISNNSSALRERLFNDFFIPTEPIDLPITTTIKMYSRDIDENKNILTDFFIYFPEDKKYEFPEWVLSNIKWDGEIIHTRFFLKNLLFLILIEVVRRNAANVVFAYSWPKAFSDETMVYFRQTWESVYEELVLKEGRVVNAKSLESTGNTITIDPPTLNASEGIAAGEFFASKLNPVASSRLRIASVCLDVGGGTTDISVWWNNKIIEDFSILFAGKQIASLLQKSGVLRKLLFSPEACIALEAKRENPTKFAAVLNHVLKVEEHEISARLINLANDDKVRRFRQMIAIEFGALAYYAGMVCFSVGLRNKRGDKSLLSEIASGGISLYWGGNAAKLLNWVDLGKYREDGLAAFLLNSLFYNCLTDKTLNELAISITPAKLQQVQSPRHKSEASGGLVAIDWKNQQHQNAHSNLMDADDMLVEMDETGMGAESDSVRSKVICGENINIEGRELPFYAIISDKDLFDADQTLFSSASIHSLERLTKFITIINTIGIRKGFFTEDTKIILTDQERQAIINSISSEFLRNQSVKASKRIIEPIFIMEVRFMMDILWNKWIK